jgi:LPXTG-motif cell wall-anchored protein
MLKEKACAGDGRPGGSFVDTTTLIIIILVLLLLGGGGWGYSRRGR